MRPASSSDSAKLAARLAESSGAFARSALRSQQGDHQVFLLHAATALEQLAKAVLASRHPSLIVASNDFDSLLHACDEGKVARRPRSRMRTINATDAIDRASRFVPTVRPLIPSLEFLALVRNAVAHLGEASAEDAEQVLISYLEASEELRSHLDFDRSAYWGEFIDLVDSALNQNVEQVRLRVETSLAVAREEFETRFGALDNTTREAMLRVIEAGYNPEKYDEQLLDCPACETPALVFGSLKVEWDEDWDHREHVLINAHPYVTFMPSGLRCNACGLELDGRDEMDAAGLADPWQLDDIDESDFLEHDIW